MLGAGLRWRDEVGVLSLGRGRGLSVLAEVGVLELEVWREDCRGGGAHSCSSMRWIGLLRERMDWTGGLVNFEGTGGGGLEGSCCVRVWFGFMFVATVLQLKWLFGSREVCWTGWDLRLRVATVSIDCRPGSIDCRPGATEGAYVVQLK